VERSKIQDPRSREDPNLKLQLTNKRRETFGAWMLMLLWILDLGAWSFVIIEV